MLAEDAFWYLDLAARTITWSRAVEELTGHRPSEAAVDTWIERTRSRDRERALWSGAHAVAEGAVAWCQDVRIARTDGTYAPDRSRASWGMPTVAPRRCSARCRT